MGNYAIDPTPALLRNAQATGTVTATTSQGPMVINERWAVAMDTTNLWTITNGATGTAALSTANGRGIAKIDLPAASDSSQFVGKGQLSNPAGPPMVSGTDIYTALTLEFEARFGTLANQDNTITLLGFYSRVGDPNRDSNDVIGFILASDALNTLTDAAATETVNVVASPPTLTNFNKYKIVIKSGLVEFWVNDVLKNSHTTNIPVTILSIGLKAKAEAGTGATTLDLGALRCFYSE